MSRPLGCALAMRVLQSPLYPLLDEAERADCDELVQRNLEWFKQDSAAGHVMGRTIDTADHVLHGPTGETWVVARVDREYLHPCGWPPSRADLNDCTLVKKATAEERAQLLRDLSQGQTEHAGWAADVLGAEARNA